MNRVKPLVAVVALALLAGCSHTPTVLHQRSALFGCTPEPLDTSHASQAVGWGTIAAEAATLAGLSNPAYYGIAAGGTWLYSAWRKAPCKQEGEQ